MAGDLPVLEPLSFSTDRDDSSHSGLRHDPALLDILCVFCQQTFTCPEKQDSLLRHLLQDHHLVIGDVKLIADLKSYLDYWRNRFKEKPISEFCPVIQTNSKPTDVAPKEEYYLLCDVLPEDKDLRNRLQQQKLETALLQQKLEREDSSFNRSCLFCKDRFTTKRADLFNHMAYDHNFSVGKPDNLVYTSEFLDILEEKISSLQCLYCEKTFKDRHVLKEHMRKKLHKKINPKNKTYDRFYIINYLEMGKNWETLQSERDLDLEPEGGDESDTGSLVDDWSDWTGDPGATVVCLFCDQSCDVADCLLHHMKETHEFDLSRIKQDRNLTFYQQVKLINYIRRQVHQLRCPVCLETSSSRQDLLQHINVSGHGGQLPDQGAWDQPQ